MLQAAATLSATEGSASKQGRMRAAISPLRTTLSVTEGSASEQDLMQAATSPLRTPTGFVIGGILSGTFWAMIGLLVWHFV